MNDLNGAQIKKFTNDEIKEKYYSRYRNSIASIKMRMSSLKYFFDSEHFGFNGHVSEISKRTLMDYFDFLNFLPKISLKTKINKWIILKSFIQFCMEYYDDFIVIVPSKMIKWKDLHKKPDSNINVFLSVEEIKKILDFLKVNHFGYYIIIRIFVETGMRKGELRNIDYDKINLEKRYIETIGKTGRKVYYFSKELRKYLRIYLEERRFTNVETKALFLSHIRKRYTNRAFNLYLKVVLKKIGLEKNVTTHTFRRSLNNLREIMGCDNEKRCILLNHKVEGVNFNHYVEKNHEKYLVYFDAWNPFQNVLI